MRMSDDAYSVHAVVRVLHALLRPCHRHSRATHPVGPSPNLMLPRVPAAHAEQRTQIHIHLRHGRCAL